MTTTHTYAFVHGGMQGGWVWDETLAALAQQTSHRFGQSHVLDVPGCGSKRGWPTDELDVAQVADELAGEMESAGLREVILV